MSVDPLLGAAAIMKALGHPLRLRAYAVLHSGALSVGQVGELLGLAPSLVSFHLEQLRRAGLIGERKTGRCRACCIPQVGVGGAWLEALWSTLSADPQVRRDRRTAARLRRAAQRSPCCSLDEDDGRPDRKLEGA